MNEQSQLMNPSQMMSQQPPPPPHPPQMMNPPPQVMNPPPQVMNPVHSQMMNQTQLLGQSQPTNHPVMGMSQPQVMNLGQSQAMMNQSLMMSNRSFNPNPNLSSKFQKPSSSLKPNNFGPVSKQSKMNRNNWKGKKITTDKRPMKEPVRRMDNLIPNPSIGVGVGVGIGPGGTGGYNPLQLSGSAIPVGGYQPPTINELQSQNRLKTRKFYPKKKFNNRYVPYAPRNTTSFIIRAKKSGGIAELVSPCPVTPAVLPTPMFSPSREVLGDMAKEEWGVDGYGSMKGLIRLRSDGHELETHDDDDDEEEGGSSESDVEEHVEVERRLDHDLSRFEMIYPSYGGFEYNNVLENRVDDQDTHIAQLEEENLTLKERLFLMEGELRDMKRRLKFLERQNMVAEDVNEEVVENESENDSEAGGSYARTSGDAKENHVEAEDVCMQDVAWDEVTVKEVSNKKNTVEESREKSVDDLRNSQDNESDVKEPAGRESGRVEKVTEEPHNKSKPEEFAWDESGENEVASEKSEYAANDDSAGSNKETNES